MTDMATQLDLLLRAIRFTNLAANIALLIAALGLCYYFWQSSRGLKRWNGLMDRLQKAIEGKEPRL